MCQRFGLTQWRGVAKVAGFLRLSAAGDFMKTTHSDSVFHLSDSTAGIFRLLVLRRKRWSLSSCEARQSPSPTSATAEDRVFELWSVRDKRVGGADSSNGRVDVSNN